MNTIINNYKSEYIINKSKFISFIYKINDINETNNILNKIKKEYKDASHICYGYKINQIIKASDDKEPFGSASHPILNTLDKNNLTNVLIIIVRYFGGIKLGASNLTRAYLKAVNDVILKNNIEEYKIYKKITIEFNYDNQKQVDYILKDYKINNKEYNDIIKYEFLYEDDKYPSNLDKYIIKKY